MKRILFFILIVISIVPKPVAAQTSLANTSGKLEKLFLDLRGNFSNNEKLVICDSIRFIIENYACSDTVFKHKFNNLKYLGQITSPDSLIKIITWNLILPDSANRYFCYIIKRSLPGNGNKVFKLSSIYHEAPILQDTLYKQSNWYGALYYDIRPFTFNNELFYAILGIDYGNIFITRKLIDVLSFDYRNELVFGKKCFITVKDLKSRIIFEFSPTAVMSLKFITDKSIIFDHLSPISPVYKDNHQFYGSDVSYDAYIFEDGYWRLKTNVDVRNKN